MRHLVVVVMFLLCLLAGPAFAGPVNINTASASELESLPGIGPSKAAAIIEYRNANGPFTSVEQLDNVPGIGPATLENLRAAATIGDGAAAAPAPAASAPGEAPAAPAPTVSSSGSGRININTASASELENLPGIGPSKAAAIVEYRSSVGPFSSCDGLSNVKGIGDATVASLRESCTTE